jgi:O-acetyl-ADP-ribose deacetylase (regulator of RNase III)
MGSGVAKALYEKWPDVRNNYLKIFNELNVGPDGEVLLGEVALVRTQGKIIANCFTQQYFGGDGSRYVNYEAVYNCMRLLHHACRQEKVNEVALPKIGCGLAGGDWGIVKAILESTFPQDFTVKVYVL